MDHPRILGDGIPLKRRRRRADIDCSCSFGIWTYSIMHSGGLPHLMLGKVLVFTIIFHEDIRENNLIVAKTQHQNADQLPGRPANLS